MLYILLFALSSLAPFSYSEDACLMPGLRKMYAENYLGLRKNYLPPAGLVKSKLPSNNRYQNLVKEDNPSQQQWAEMKAIEKGYKNHHARLIGLKAIGQLDRNQKLEIEAFDATNGDKLVAELAVKGTNRTPRETARYSAMMESGGNYRAAFLAEEDLLGKLSAGEKAELAALKMTYGDHVYADIKKKQADIIKNPAGSKLTPCEKDYMTLIDGILGLNPHADIPATDTTITN
jgi:hypothetical protein